MKANNRKLLVKPLTNQVKERKYTVCRVIYQNLSVQKFQSQYPLIPHLTEVWDELNGVEGINLTVDKDSLTLHNQVVSSACESIATFYNNYYIESFEKYHCKLFIYMICQAFHQEKIHTFLNPLTLEMKNCIPAFPAINATLSNAPFSIMPVFKHILEKYESLLVEATLPVPVSQIQIIPQE
ncbi:uncharacterized protein EV154DRAFT_579180 [Mucor mucedo]|uniref:uncharacterized protein n=1 Tax=Mucor mucedo TaxID=29922 RepID=UPI00221F49CA|nr:uncharacterized protein EV154DRAFT_579180 [Mucor mucedo]KAI7894230.1 hypothetical protein EV154DRAFT_579180 [Mucor mucedo]